MRVAIPEPTRCPSARETSFHSCPGGTEPSPASDREGVRVTPGAEGPEQTGGDVCGVCCGAEHRRHS